MLDFLFLFLLSLVSCQENTEKPHLLILFIIPRPLGSDWSEYSHDEDCILVGCVSD